MTEEQTKFLYSIADNMGTTGIENFTCKDGEKMREIIKALEQQPSNVCEYNRGYRDGYDKGNLNGYEIRKAEEKKSEDCVSRAEVFEIMGNLMSIPYDFDRPINKDDVSESMDEIKDLPPVTPTQSWIPVSERLPEVGEKVLCQCQANIYDVLKLTVDGWYYDKNHCYMSGFVIAWQPLPKPYEEK